MNYDLPSDFLIYKDSHESIEELFYGRTDFGYFQECAPEIKVGDCVRPRFDAFKIHKVFLEDLIYILYPEECPAMAFKMPILEVIEWYLETRKENILEFTGDRLLHTATGPELFGVVNSHVVAKYYPHTKHSIPWYVLEGTVTGITVLQYGPDADRTQILYNPIIHPNNHIIFRESPKSLYLGEVKEMYMLHHWRVMVTVTMKHFDIDIPYYLLRIHEYGEKEV